MKKLDLNIYELYRDTIDRYMDLVPCEHKEKVNTSTLHILYAIEEINYLLERYNSKESDISIYYRMMIKTDFLINVVEFLYNLFYEIKDRKKIWGNDFQNIRKFRLYRSLTLAHPLETTYYDDLGYGKTNEKWCEEVLLNNRMLKMMNKELCNADYVIVIKEKEKVLSEYIPITISDDILSIVLISLNHIRDFTKKIEMELVTNNLS